ncbi:DUF2169 family type VI secretion system accessory protein [Sorangium sp. So ce1000]|uniref:DUF2169 family type VI secretion system accessory protein n=1 Tax=Sorangium sp. So ce1000 TaxID=3133325 RepID=UPI003F644080
MELVNATNLDMNATESLDKSGRPWLVVVAKATYRIPAHPAAAPELSDRPRGLLYKDVFEGEDGLSTPLFENDLVPFKPACDVIVKGSARAPQGNPVTETTAGIKVGPIEKAIRVLGNRTWVKRLSGYEPSRPAPFVSVPITYSRAFGGAFDHRAIGSDDPADFLAHPANLVGCGYARGKFLKLLEGRPAPNLEAPGVPISDPEKLYAPMSLGPIARNWAPRLALAGTYDQTWRDEIFPLLPPDFDERYHQSAPADQQMPYPKGGEEVTLLNLLSASGVASFRLPDLELPMVALSRRHGHTALAPVVDTLAIDADAATFDLVWRARLPLARSIDEIHTVAAGSVCKRWWKSRVFGTEDCGCGGVETSDEDLAPVTKALD